MSGPHDKLFKSIFQQIEQATSMLKAVLPSHIVQALDWNTLRVERGHFVSKAQRELRSDILFSIQMGTQRGFIYVLVEHQSTPEYWMPLRMWGYEHEIWKGYLDEDEDADLLPFILPVVIFHSEKQWSTPRRFSELFQTDSLTAELRQYVPELPLFIVDLTEMDEAALWERSLTDMARVALFLLKMARHSRTLKADLERWLEALGRVLRAPNGLAAVIAFLNYAMEVGEIDPKDVLELAQSLGSSVQEAVMTGAQKLIEQGREKGLVEGQTQVLLKLLRLKFGELPSEVEARVKGASVEELECFAERVLQAQTLDQIFS